MNPRTRLGEEARFELSLGAVARERRNRPVAVLGLAIGLVAAAGVFAMYSVSARASARGGLSRALDDQARAEVGIEQWKKLVQQQETSPRGAVGKPGEFKLSKMEELATRAGMKTRPNAPTPTDDKSRPGIVVNKYIYTEVRDPSLSAMVEWVRSACAEIGGLEVETMTIRPEPAGWKLSVTFRRWERAGT